MATGEQNKAMVIILSAPSGAGKTTIAKKLLEADPKLSLSISATTRPPRLAERDSVDYFFKSKDKFEQMIKAGELLEYAKIYDNMYGTPREYVENQLARGFDVLFDIDTQGAYQIMEKMPSRVLSIFILPPNLEVLRERLEGRASDDEKIIEKRLKLAQEEMSHAKNYDYNVINDDLERAVQEVQNIIEQTRVGNGF